jgi:hypothetical protein
MTQYLIYYCFQKPDVLSESKDDLKGELHILHGTMKQFGMQIQVSPLKFKVMRCKCRVTIRSKIVYWSKQMHSYIWVEKFHTRMIRS